MARQLEAGGFSLSASSRLDGSAIRPVVTQPRKLHADGSTDLEVFAFILTNPADMGSFHVGKVIELQP